MAESTGKSPMEPHTSRLQKWQRNRIFETIREVKLDPREFDLEDDGVEVRIKHKWSESYFVIGGGTGDYGGRSVVGDGVDWKFEAYTWQALISRMSLWLEDVRHDLETPDLWAELRRGNELLGAISDDIAENTPFTSDEQKEIAWRLRELAEEARSTYSLSEEQMRALNAKLDYLVKAAGRLGRIDWRNAFVGVISGYILAAALPPESVHDILLGLFRSISYFYGLPELPTT
jgi:hypothetical protein